MTALDCEVNSTTRAAQLKDKGSITPADWNYKENCVFNYFSFILYLK